MTETTKRALIDVTSILANAGWTDNSINIGGNVTNSQVGQTLTNCTNTIQEQAPGEAKSLLEHLQSSVKALIEKLPADKADEAEPIADKLETIVKQVTSKKPEREWYSLSAKGLLEAAKFVKDFTGDIGGTLLNLGKLKFGDEFKLPQI